MNITDKLRILSDSAKYDVSCSSSGNSRNGKKGSIGNTTISGICHSWSDDGRCVSLLKILFTNDCMYNCAYCVNRSTNDIERATFTPEEVADLTINFYRRNYIEGLFLSSGVFKSPDHTMELMLKTVRLLREVHNYNGYIHLKAIPGASLNLIQQAGKYADRMSVNIELPSSNGLKLLAPQKKKEAIVTPMKYLGSKILQTSEEKKRFRHVQDFVPAGQTTQLIIGATPDPDINILTLSENLYKHFSLKRVYYSAYIPVASNPNLPALITKPPTVREHRLYQADWLLRFYGFSASELLNKDNPNLDIDFDPKCDWALRNISLFPVEINKADYEMLLRVPGIGVKSAQKILIARRMSSLGFDDLKKLGIVLKRARHFITCKGKYYSNTNFNDSLIRNALREADKFVDLTPFTGEQLHMFSYDSTLNDIIVKGVV